MGGMPNHVGARNEPLHRGRKSITLTPPRRFVIVIGVIDRVTISAPSYAVPDCCGRC